MVSHIGRKRELQCWGEGEMEWLCGCIANMRMRWSVSEWMSQEHKNSFGQWPRLLAERVKVSWIAISCPSQQGFESLAGKPLVDTTPFRLIFQCFKKLFWVLNLYSVLWKICICNLLCLGLLSINWFILSIHSLVTSNGSHIWNVS